MSHYEERLQHDLDRIRQEVQDLAALIEESLDRSVQALLTMDKDLASETVLGDLKINRASRRLDSHCHAFVARHLPSAGHLRFISSVMRMSIGLERIGDYAVTVCREAVQLSKPAPPAVARDIEMMADQARRVFRQAIKAFKEDSAEMAYGAMGLTNQLASTFEKVFEDLVQAAESGETPVRDSFALLVVFNRLERVSDQAKNLCEETVFAAIGEGKQPKVYQVLFVDEDNSCASQMAELVARKAFPESGAYASAGWAPAPKVSAALTEFLDQRGFDVLDAKPKQLHTIHDELSDYHVIVDLAGGARERIPDVPFHTTLLHWDVASEAGATLDGNSKDSLKALYDALAHRVRDLMTAMRGEEAR